MSTTLEVLFAPAEFAALAGRDLSQAACVVFDVFRATSTIVTALAHGAKGIIPVAEIPEALALRGQHPDCLLAGERDGLRIRANLTGGIDFDHGNSPREFTGPHIRNRTIIISTTNGSRALRACSKARAIFACSFLNLQATADFLLANPFEEVLLVCSGTHEETAYEDVLGAGALANLLFPIVNNNGIIADSARVAMDSYLRCSDDLLARAGRSRNGARLLGMPELRDDVTWCLKRDAFPLVARMENGMIRKV